MLGADKKKMKHFVLMKGQRRPMVKQKAKPVYPDFHHTSPARTLGPSLAGQFFNPGVPVFLVSDSTHFASAVCLSK